MPYFSQTTRDTGGRGHGDTYMHPFKVLISNTSVYVMQGWLYLCDNGRVWDKRQLKIASTNLGNVFLGETLPTLTLENGLLWIKVTLSSGICTAAEIVYETDANAIDTATVRWILIARTYTTRLVEQFLKSDVVVDIRPEKNYFTVKRSAVLSVTVEGGVVLAPVISGTSPIHTAISLPMTSWAVGSTSFSTIVNDDEIVLEIEWAKEVYTCYLPVTVDPGVTDAYGELKTDGYYYAAGTIKRYASGSVPADTMTFTYVRLAKVKVTSSRIVTIEQYHTGVVTVYPVILPYGTHAGP